ncbi:MAG: hypothetical protein EOP09_12640, partial [Proteobacteria bacterium]
YATSAKANQALVVNATSALRIEISNYLLALDPVAAVKEGFGEEIELLSGLNVDGIITTNWDQFLEHLFPDYKTYIGQRQLLFSNPQEIGEIYKIHGCVSEPQSLVLTSDDYFAFQERNPYLAAKLITVFVEHPVIFIGYSLADPNVASLLRAIALCIGPEHVEHLRKNLIFVQRLKADEAPGIADTYLAIDGVQIPLVLVKTNDFSEVYRALGATRRKIPARVLRHCKEQLYELVKSLEPEKKLCIVDIDEIERKDDVEFFVGVGVATQDSPAVGERGYEAIEIKDLVGDALHEDRGFDASRIVNSVIPRVGRYSRYVPVFKYLRAVGIESWDDYERRGLKLEKWAEHKIKDYRVDVYAAGYKKRKDLSMKDLIDGSTPENAAVYIPFLPPEEIDLNLLREFLIKHEEKVDAKGNYSTYFRKLVTLYDRMKWGWGWTE